MAGQDAVRRSGTRLLRVATVALATLVLGPVGIAYADPPELKINSPVNGSASPQTPTFEGYGDPDLEDGGPVTLTIHRGSAAGPLVQTITGVEPVAWTVPMPEWWEPPGTEPGIDSGTWTVTPATLEAGTYTAVATQENTPIEPLPREKVEQMVTFTVGSPSPFVETGQATAIGQTTATLNAIVNPNGGEVNECTFEYGTTGSYGTPAPCTPSPGPGSTPVAVSAPVGGLSAGTTYHFRIVAGDSGNTGLSVGGDQTFTTATPPPEPPTSGPASRPAPAAAFSWFPSAPQTGQNVSLVSTSTDSASAITGFAWALTAAGPFQVGGPLLTTSFSTPGNHVVRLRVTDASGASSIATETIPVSSVSLNLMQPFPIVRIAGNETSSGARLRLLTAQAPVGAHVTVTCRGRGCPTKSEGQVALSRTKGGTVVVEFRRFERSLRAGVILEIRVSKSGEIGKFTRFVIRHGKLPERVDMCLDAAGVTPLVCPSS